MTKKNHTICFSQVCSFFKQTKNIITDFILTIAVFCLWIFGKQTVPYTILILLGCCLLIRFLLHTSKTQKEKIFSFITAGTFILLYTIITGFAPKQYTGELIFDTVGPSNTQKVLIEYKDLDNYKSAETMQNNPAVFEINEEFIASDEIVIHFSSDTDSHSEQLKLVKLKIYCNNFLIDKISGRELRSCCTNMVNLAQQDMSAANMLLDWDAKTDYAQIFLDHTFPERISNDIAFELTTFLQAVYFALVILAIKSLIVYLSSMQAVKQYMNRKSILCLHILILSCTSVCEVLFVEIISGNYGSLSTAALLLNIASLIFINTMLLSIGNLQIALTITGILYGILGIANYYTLLFRGSPILPWDIYSVNTALNVMDNYNIYITPQIAGKLLIIIIPVYICYFVPKDNVLAAYNRQSCKKRFTVFAVSFLCCTGLMSNTFITSLGIQEDVYIQKENYARNGWLLATRLNMKYIKIQKPQNFSEAKIQEILQEYPQAEDLSSDDAPNIVIILNESFADLQSIYPFVTNEEVMPFINSLSGSHVAKGTCFVSQNGGGTCNSEYELLTGSTMAFFPTGSVIFQQHMNSEQYSLINSLNRYGYHTVGMHPMSGSNWDRTKAYPLLQFNDYVFSEDLGEPTYIREYASDEYCYQWIIEQFKNKAEDEKLAIYNLTVQNHGGYEQEDYTGDILLEQESNPALEQYLSLIHESDRALEELLSWLSNIDEKVILLFMGDHQPYISSLVDYPKSSDFSLCDYFSVPYILWNNYGETMDVPEQLSINYLASYLLQNAHLPQSPYYQFLAEMSEEVPVIISSGYKENGTFYEWADKPFNEWIEKYKILQYGLNSTKVILKEKYYE